MLAVYPKWDIHHTSHPSKDGDLATGYFEVTGEIHPTLEWMECMIYTPFRVYT